MTTWRSTLLPLTCATALFISGCSAGDNDLDDATTESVEEVTGDSGEEGTETSADTEVEDALDDAGVDADAGEGDASHPFSELPDEFPLPDEHLLLRSMTHEGEPMGHSLEVALATDGTVEERISWFENALGEVYGEVEVTEPEGFTESPTVLFTGPGFEYGAVAIGDNEGYMDSGDIDSSHLPVYFSVVLEENPRN